MAASIGNDDMDIGKLEVSPELREAMQRFADAIGDVGRTGKAIGEMLGRMFPDGFPKFDIKLNLNFNLVERPKTIADILVEDEYQRMRHERQALN